MRTHYVGLSLSALKLVNTAKVVPTDVFFKGVRLVEYRLPDGKILTEGVQTFTNGNIYLALRDESGWVEDSLWPKNEILA